MRNYVLLFVLPVLLLGCYDDLAENFTDILYQDKGVSDIVNYDIADDFSGSSDIRSDDAYGSDELKNQDSGDFPDSYIPDSGAADIIYLDVFSDAELNDGCLRDCRDKDCGDDGCGGECGTCGNDEFCSKSFKCEKLCKNECASEGVIKCDPDGRFRRCVKDSDGCLVYSEPQLCPGGALCFENECADVKFIAPADNSSLKNPVEFRVDTTKNIKRVVYDADGYLFGSSEDAQSGFYYKYSFNKYGKRVITASGYDGTAKDARLIAKASVNITVIEDIPEVPYFCQYKNSIYPESTCQNTSIAMLLRYFGWNGKPDDITSEFGKDYAQSPSGLAYIFNTLAQRSGITKRLTPHDDGTVQNVRELLAKGLPVIVHGYFTSYGHVLVILGYRDGKYIVNDPAGRWSEVFKGGYADYCDTSSYGPKIEYSAPAFEKAIATWDGSTPAPVWYHEIK